MFNFLMTTGNYLIGPSRASASFLTTNWSKLHKQGEDTFGFSDAVFQLLWELTQEALAGWNCTYCLYFLSVSYCHLYLYLFHTISRVANFWSDFKIWRRISLFKISAFSRFALFARIKSRGNKNIFHVLFSMKWKTGNSLFQ